MLGGIFHQQNFSALIGDIDEEVEGAIDYENLKAMPLPAITH